MEGRANDDTGVFPRLVGGERLALFGTWGLALRKNVQTVPLLAQCVQGELSEGCCPPNVTHYNCQ